MKFSILSKSPSPFQKKTMPFYINKYRFYINHFYYLYENIIKDVQKNKDKIVQKLSSHRFQFSNNFFLYT